MIKKIELNSDIMITVNGCAICYDDFGSGAMPIIFIHGFPFNKNSWQPQIDFFKNQNRVIAYDIRGFGKSISEDRPFSITLFADDLIQFMNALKIEKAIVCGLSMGGYILLNALNRYPERFSAIVLCDTQCIADSDDVKENRTKTIASIKTDGLTEFGNSFTQSIFSKETLDTKNELVERIKTIILNTSPNAITTGMVALSERQETCNTLNKIVIPTLIICGKEDGVTPLKQSEFLLQSIKNAEMVIIDNSGHLSNLEQPDIFNSEFLKFIKHYIS